MKAIQDNVIPFKRKRTLSEARLTTYNKKTKKEELLRDSSLRAFTYIVRANDETKYISKSARELLTNLGKMILKNPKGEVFVNHNFLSDITGCRSSKQNNRLLTQLNDILDYKYHNHIHFQGVYMSYGYVMKFTADGEDRYNNPLKFYSSESRFAPLNVKKCPPELTILSTTETKMSTSTDGQKCPQIWTKMSTSNIRYKQEIKDIAYSYISFISKEEKEKKEERYENEIAQQSSLPCFGAASQPDCLEEKSKACEVITAKEVIQEMPKPKANMISVADVMADVAKALSDKATAKREEKVQKPAEQQAQNEAELPQESLIHETAWDKLLWHFLVDQEDQPQSCVEVGEGNDKRLEKRPMTLTEKRNFVKQILPLDDIKISEDKDCNVIRIVPSKPAQLMMFRNFLQDKFEKYAAIYGYSIRYTEAIADKSIGWNDAAVVGNKFAEADLLAEIAEKIAAMPKTYPSNDPSYLLATLAKSKI